MLILPSSFASSSSWSSDVSPEAGDQLPFEVSEPLNVFMSSGASGFLPPFSNVASILAMVQT